MVLRIALSLVVLSSCCSKKSATNNVTDYTSMVVIDDNSFPMETELNTIDEQMEEVDSDAAIAELTIDDTPPEPGDLLMIEGETFEMASNQLTPRIDHSQWNALLKKYVSDEGRVDYKGFIKDKVALRSYLQTLDDNKPESSWAKEEKLAYWINAYNAMTIDLIIRNWPVESIKDISDPWKQRLWKLGDKWYNLDEIEHDILRKMDEPRIHFALVCASYSCPKLLNDAFTSTEIESQLSMVTRDFLADKSKNQISPNELKLSKIFQWFARDFKQNGSLIDFLNTYSDTEISQNASKKFMDYNWSLND